jgi:lambda family phage portal protein
MLKFLRHFRSTPPPPPRTAARSFDGAAVNALTLSWRTTNYAIDAELRTDLDRLRARSRGLFKNNEYGAKFRRLVRNNVVGPEGFGLQVRSQDPGGKMDDGANRAIESAFWKWSRPDQCDVTGKRSFADICRAAVEALARDGEFLIRKRRGAGAGDFSYQLQLLDVDRLDTIYNVWPADGRNAVIMGVEIDVWRKPVAYHLWNRHPTEAPSTSRVRERVPAEEIFHGYVAMEDEQSRGIPWLHAAMRRMNDLNGYREAAVIAARVGAAKMGVWETPDGLPPPGAEEATPGSGDYFSEATPGHFDYAPPGYKLTTFNPDYPHAQFEAFCAGALRGIASGIGVAYHSLANDLSSVNYSSIRSGALEERDEWMVIQNWLITNLLVPVYEEWLTMALLRGAILLNNGSALPLAKKSKFMDHQWQGRRWQWVDPLKDMAASVLAIENGLASPQQIAAQTGRDIEEVIDDMARFQALLKAKGVTLNGTTAPTGTVASAVKESGNDAGKQAAAGKQTAKKSHASARLRALVDALNAADE